jgi:hypothetical protein
MIALSTPRRQILVVVSKSRNNSNSSAVRHGIGLTCNVLAVASTNHSSISGVRALKWTCLLSCMHVLGALAANDEIRSCNKRSSSRSLPSLPRQDESIEKLPSRFFRSESTCTVICRCDMDNFIQPPPVTVVSSSAALWRA